MPSPRPGHAPRPVRLPRADTITGTGPWAVVAPCGGYVTVTRHPDEPAARRVLDRLAGTGCGGRCWPGRHRLVGPVAG
jgi:hypothetical protein